MACMPVGRRVKTCLTSVLECVPYIAHIEIWDMIAWTIHGSCRSQCVKTNDFGYTIILSVIDRGLADDNVNIMAVYHMRMFNRAY